MTRSQKKEGSISDIFTSLNPDGFGKAALPDRFIDLKKSLWNAGLVQSWRDVLGELEVATSVLVERKKRGVDVSACCFWIISQELLTFGGTQVIPRISYEELKGGLSKSLAEEIKRVGSVVVTGAVPKEVCTCQVWLTSPFAVAYTHHRKPSAGNAQSRNTPLSTRIVSKVRPCTPVIA